MTTRGYRITPPPRWGEKTAMIDTFPTPGAAQDGILEMQKWPLWGTPAGSETHPCRGGPGHSKLHTPAEGSGLVSMSSTGSHDKDIAARLLLFIRYSPLSPFPPDEPGDMDQPGCMRKTLMRSRARSPGETPDRFTESVLNVSFLVITHDPTLRLRGFAGICRVRGHIWSMIGAVTVSGRRGRTLASRPTRPCYPIACTFHPESLSRLIALPVFGAGGRALALVRSQSNRIQVLACTCRPEATTKSSRGMAV